MYSRPIRSLVLLVALSASVLAPTTYAFTADPVPEQSLTQSLKDEVSREVAAQVKDAIAPAMQAAKDGIKTGVSTSVQNAASKDSPPVSQVADIKPSAGARIANVGADVLETLVSKAKSYGGKIEDGLSKAVDYGMTEIPIVVTEFLKWRLWRHGIYAFIPGAAVLAAIIAAIVLIGRANKDRWNSDGLCMITAIWSAATLVGGSVIVWNIVMPNLMSFIQILVAPRIYLLESLAHLVK